MCVRSWFVTTGKPDDALHLERETQQTAPPTIIKKPQQTGLDRGQEHDIHAIALPSYEETYTAALLQSRAFAGTNTKTHRQRRLLLSMNTAQVCTWYYCMYVDKQQQREYMNVCMYIVDSRPSFSSCLQRTEICQIP